MAMIILHSFILVRNYSLYTGEEEDALFWQVDCSSNDLLTQQVSETIQT